MSSTGDGTGAAELEMRVRRLAGGCRCGDTVVVTVSGEIDLSTVPRLGAFLKRRLASLARVVVLDLSNVTFLDCAGVELLSRCQQHAEARSVSLRLVCDTSGRVDRVFTLAGVAHHFTRFPSVHSALHDRAPADGSLLVNPY